MRRAAFAAALLVAVAACEPVVPGTERGDEEPAGAGGGSAELGSPVRETPQTVVGAVQRATPTAQAWQSDPVPVELSAQLDGGRVRTAEVVFLAAEADRFSTVTLEGEVVTDVTTTLSTIEVEPVTAAGLEEIPDLPEDLLDPGALVEGAAGELAACDIDPGGAVTVRYSTGAPYGWEGESWADDLEWTAAVTAGSGEVRVLPLDPASAEPLGECEVT